jgi:hypothetical protein
MSLLLRNRLRRKKLDKLYVSIVSGCVSGYRCAYSRGLRSKEVTEAA